MVRYVWCGSNQNTGAGGGNELADASPNDEEREKVVDGGGIDKTKLTKGYNDDG